MIGCPQHHSLFCLNLGGGDTYVAQLQMSRSGRNFFTFKCLTSKGMIQRVSDGGSLKSIIITMKASASICACVQACLCALGLVMHCNVRNEVGASKALPLAGLHGFHFPATPEVSACPVLWPELSRLSFKARVSKLGFNWASARVLHCCRPPPSSDQGHNTLINDGNVFGTIFLALRWVRFLGQRLMAFGRFVKTALLPRSRVNTVIDHQFTLDQHTLEIHEHPLNTSNPAGLIQTSSEIPRR